MKFGDKILQFRKENKWSQEELAKKLQTSAAMVGKYERNEINPSVEVARKLSKIFSVTVDYLVNEDSINVLQDKKMIDRLSDINQLPEKEKEYITYTLDAMLRDAKAKKAYIK